MEKEGGKVIVVSRKWRYPYTHDLSTLITELLKFGIDAPADVQDCPVLKEYAVEGRCPDFAEPVFRSLIGILRNSLGQYP